MGIFSKRRKKSILAPNRILRWLGPGATIAGLLWVVYQLTFGGFSFDAVDSLLAPTEEGQLIGQTIPLGDRSDRPVDRIRVATFNIKHFSGGPSAAQTAGSNFDVMEKVARIASTFDVLAIQEVRDDDGAALKRLVALINESGGTFAATMSDPLGNPQAGDRESYAFLWDESRIRLVEGTSYVVLDEANRLYREPMVASFQVNLPTSNHLRPFRFTMINVHTEPNQNRPEALEQEIDVLADVLQRVRQYEYEQNQEDDFILLGDLNADTARLRPLTSIPGIISLAADLQSQLGTGETDDHILIDSHVTAEYSGKRGVIDLQAALQLTPEQVELLSDHSPVWAEFSIYERPPLPATAANQSAEQPRIIR